MGIAQEDPAPSPTAVPRSTLEDIRQFDTCTVANAMEHFRVRLRNEGFTRPGLRVLTGDAPRLIGYAATCRVRTGDPPMVGRAFVDRTDWWDGLSQLPLPRIAVIQDLDAPHGGASVVGEVHAAILRALGCDGLITNGSVRDIPAVSRMPFAMFAASASVSHAYMHVIDFGSPVEIFGLPVHHGDLLYADVHGVLSIPADLATRLPQVASGIQARESEIIALCQSPEFSVEKLRKAVQSK